TRVPGITEIPAGNGNQVCIADVECWIRVAAMSVIADGGGHVGAKDRRAGQTSGSTALGDRAVVRGSECLGRSKASARSGCARIGNAIGERAAEEQDVTAGVHGAADYLRDGGIDLGDWAGLQIEEIREVCDRTRRSTRTVDFNQSGLRDGIACVSGGCVTV